MADTQEQATQSAQSAQATQATNEQVQSAQTTQATQATQPTQTSQTNQTATGQPAQATQAAQATDASQAAQATETASFVPAWQVKSDKLKEAVQQGYGVQVVYKSTNEESCEPTLVTEEQASDNYPFVVEEPVGFIAPKFLWNGTTRGWIETASIQQGKVLAEAQNNIAELQQQVTDFGKTAGQVDTANKQIQADKTEFTNAITALKQNSQETSSAIQTQLGQLITMVSSLAAANKSEAQTTAQSTASQPAEAQATATTASSAESTQSTTAQTTNA
jgi:hypothetical protein